MSAFRIPDKECTMLVLWQKKLLFSFNSFNFSEIPSAKKINTFHQANVIIEHIKNMDLKYSNTEYKVYFYITIF